jgi:cytochrome c-type biogenesis protein CcmH/NrfG
LNLRELARDQVQVTLGNSCMKTVRPDNSDPIPLQTQPPHMGTIMIRFVGLLTAAVIVLALIWSR